MPSTHAQRHGARLAATGPEFTLTRSKTPDASQRVKPAAGAASELATADRKSRGARLAYDTERTERWCFAHSSMSLPIVKAAAAADAAAATPTLSALLDRIPAVPDLPPQRLGFPTRLRDRQLGPISSQDNPPLTGRSIILEDDVLLPASVTRKAKPLTSASKRS